MTTEQLRDYLVSLGLTDAKFRVRVEPCLSVARCGRIWRSFGYCFLSSSKFPKQMIEGYKGRSLEPMTYQTEERAFIDMLHEEIGNTFREAGLTNVTLDFRAATKVPWNSWN